MPPVCMEGQRSDPHFVCPSLAVIQVWNPSSSLPFNRLVFTLKLSSHKVMFYNVYRQIAPAAFSTRWPCSPFTPFEPKYCCVLLGLFYVCLVFFFQLYRLSESREWFSAPQPLFFISFSPRIVHICIAFLSVCAYCWPFSFLAGLCNTSQYNELQLPSSQYIHSSILLFS